MRLTHDRAQSLRSGIHSRRTLRYRGRSAGRGDCLSHRWWSDGVPGSQGHHERQRPRRHDRPGLRAPARHADRPGIQRGDRPRGRLSATRRATLRQKRGWLSDRPVQPASGRQTRVQRWDAGTERAVSHEWTAHGASYCSRGYVPVQSRVNI